MVNQVFLISIFYKEVCDDHSATWHFYFKDCSLTFSHNVMWQHCKMVEVTLLQAGIVPISPHELLSTRILQLILPCHNSAVLISQIALLFLSNMSHLGIVFELQLTIGWQMFRFVVIGSVKMDQNHFDDSLLVGCALRPIDIKVI